MLSEFYDFKTGLWKWQSETATPWYFLTLPDDISSEIKFFCPRKGPGFGSLRVEVTIGKSVWRTSIFPSKETKRYILPVKAAIRKAENFGEGDTVTCRLKVIA
ncbi:DUF1905 domain-containing protein [Robiginitomaculum antarcticum]|uniref:DUF1905 domain-containing protein n=1 Tax=Robiginitomaculum antarcticum TaxID=437507 RepID=UPI0003791A71|nr:DUF1905 domain-containing protein [Robiginitomaculum antarcticum]